jgi:hypothetical protein
VTTPYGSKTPTCIDGTGTSATLGFVGAGAGLVVDAASGVAYLSDSGNHVIRTVSPAGEVVTVAGTVGVSGSADGPASAATFNAPAGLALDGAGGLLVADSENNALRRVDLSTGTVTTLAGDVSTSGAVDDTGTAAQFYAPVDVAVSGGVAYVVDGGNFLIRAVDLSTAVVTTLAGTAFDENAGCAPTCSLDGIGGAAYFSAPVGVAVDPSGTSLLVVDAGPDSTISNDILRRVDVATGAVTTVAGGFGCKAGPDAAWQCATGYADGVGTTSLFTWPKGVAFDADGNAYVADFGNCRVRRVDGATGEVSTLAGQACIPDIMDSENDAPPYFADGVGAAAKIVPLSVAYDASSGALLVYDALNLAVRTVDLGSGAVSTLAGGTRGVLDSNGPSATFREVGGVAAMGTSSSPGLLVADDAGVRRIDVGTGAVGTLAGDANDVGYVDGVGAAARFAGTAGIVVHPVSGVAYVAQDDYTFKGVRQVFPNGTVGTLAGSSPDAPINGVGTFATFDNPTAVELAANGDLFVLDVNNNIIRKVAAADGAVSTWAGGATCGSGDETCALDGTGTAAAFYSPVGMALDAAGGIYVADNQESGMRLRYVSAAQVVTTVAGAPNAFAIDGATGTFNGVAGVAVAPAGDAYYVVDGGRPYNDCDSSYVSNSIRRVDKTTGAVTTVAGAVQGGYIDGPALSARFCTPTAATFDSQGNLLIVDAQNHLIRKLDMTSNTVTTVAGGAGSTTKGYADGVGTSALFDQPSAIAVHGSLTYIADANNCAIRRMYANGTVDTIAGRGFCVELYGAPLSEFYADGQGTAAVFNSGIGGLAVDSTGNVFVAVSSSTRTERVPAAFVGPARRVSRPAHASPAPRMHLPRRKR